jgi:ATP-dependent DNA helicase DinG
MRSIVAFDIETTGLDPQRDAVIEVGAVRFKGDRIEAEWSTLVNPGRPLPPFIVQLTGITDAMLAGAPRIIQILPELEAFIGDDPILGHNVAFDVSFMHQRGIFALNPTLDTYDLASVLMPAAGRYGLSALASALAVPVRSAHRALDDAHTTRQIYLQLYRKALEIPAPILEEITRLGEEIEWGAGMVFDEAYQSVDGDGKQHTLELFPAPPKPPKVNFEAVEPAPIDKHELAAIFEPSGELNRHFEGYEHRAQQVSMATAVIEAFNQNQHLLVEAGTGTGKSIAYLVPAFQWADQNRQRVVISTNTLNLQDQLIHKDVPDLNAALGKEYHAAVLKGRGNYLCPRRFNALRSLGPRNPEEMRVLAKLLLWLSQKGSGERSELNLPMGEMAVWSRLSAEDDDCSLEACASHTGGRCPYYRARLAAESAHVIIVNHALLLADITTGSRVIPEYKYLIVDEAHHLEPATTQGLSFKVSEFEVKRVFRDLGSQQRGLLRQLIDLARRTLPPDGQGQVETVIATTAERVEECTAAASVLFERLNELLENQREGKPVGPYGQQVRILPATRTLPDWEGVEIAWENLREPLATITGALNDLANDLENLEPAEGDPVDTLAVAMRIARRSLAEIFAQMENMIFEPDPIVIYWIELSSQESRLTLHAAPLEVGPLVERYLWHEKESVVMTSATLTTGGEFDFIRRRLYAEDADELALGSPFDYETSTLLYLISDIPEPVDRGNYQRAVESGLIRLLRATGGRGLVLFTSNLQLQTTARAISEPLAQSGIQVYEQSSGASRHALLEAFRTSDSAVLLGTRSFWEGIDVPGPALSVLAIIRLPFEVPSDPIVAARAETYESPFDQYMVPEAILRFRQGFGRLIRTRSDRGVVAIFDRRLLSKAYGQAFVESLPRCTVRQGSLADLPEAAQRWLNI